MLHVVTPPQSILHYIDNGNLYNWSYLSLCDIVLSPPQPHPYNFLSTHLPKLLATWKYSKFLQELSLSGLASASLIMPLEQKEGQEAPPKPLMGANEHPNASQEGERHDVMLLQDTTLQVGLTRLCIEMPYKCYGIHSNEVLDRYFYYNPKDFVWMCQLTDTPACKNAVQEIEQQLENESDLNF